LPEERELDERGAAETEHRSECPDSERAIVGCVRRSSIPPRQPDRSSQQCDQR
jgi:hypothetical protein